MLTIVSIVAFGLLVWLFLKFWNVRAYYKGLTGKDWVLLELRLPREIQKTPQAMEVVLNQFHIKGLPVSPVWFALEMVSIEGKVRFFVRTQRNFKPSIEAQFFAQYPNVEVYEVEDYSRKVTFDKENGYDLWGLIHKFKKNEVYPIKTYVDFGIDTKNNPKEEVKVDPMTSTIEYLSSLGPGEQCWIQFLVTQASDRPKPKDGGGKKKSEPEPTTEGLGDIAKKEVEKILKREEPKPPKDGEEEKKPPFIPSPGESDLVKAIEKNVSKKMFDVGIRTIYLAKKDSYDKEHQGGMLGVFSQYGSSDLNAIEPDMTTSTGVWYGGQEKYLLGTRFKWREESKWFPIGTTKEKKESMLLAYQLRSYFHPPFKQKPMAMSSEELATIFHLPGGVVQGPGIERIESKKAEPPVNLPT